MRQKERVPGRRKSRVRFNEKRQRLAEVLAENPDLSYQKAGELAGYSPASARQSVNDVVHSKSFQERFREIMDSRPGLRNEALLKKLDEGSNATKKTYAIFGGRITDERVDEDFGTRFSYVDLAMKLKGLTNKVEVTASVSRGPDLSGLSTGELRALVETLSKMKGGA